MIYRILILLLILSYAHAGLGRAVIDSLRTEKIKGKKYIIHRVEPKETLYSIAKRYNVSVEILNEQNPSLSNGLKMYDEIQVPLIKNRKRTENLNDKPLEQSFHIVQQGETLFALSRQYNLSVDSLIIVNALKDAHLNLGDTIFLGTKKLWIDSNNTIAKSTENQTIYHIVKTSETLFGIAQTYHVEIEDLQKWNQMSDYTLSIGQKLKVSDRDKQIADTLMTQAVAKEAPKVEKPEAQPLDTLYVKTDNSQFKTKTKKIEGRNQTVEEGFVMQIEDTDYTKKFLALHRTAALGSTIVVKNQMTNQVIEARVVGKLPESAMNRKLLMRLSAAAYSALGAIDLKTPVTVSYSMDE